MNHSKIKIAPILSIAAIALLACMGTIAQAFAQGPSQPNAAQHAQATPLPLSGRAGNSGSVTAIEAPIAGTTNSVTTINPSVQVQGPYAGSSSSTAKLPFTGKLSLRDAIQRGLNFNLGAANLNRAVAPGPGTERDRAQRAASQRQRLPRREPGANQPRRRRPAHPHSHPRLQLPHHRRPVQQHRPARQRLAVGPRSHRMEQLPRIQRIRPRRAALRPRCPRRRRPRGLRHVSPDHRNQRARRLRPRAARHRNRALPADAAEAAGRPRRPDRR